MNIYMYIGDIQLNSIIEIVKLGELKIYMRERERERELSSTLNLNYGIASIVIESNGLLYLPKACKYRILHSICKWYSNEIQ